MAGIPLQLHPVTISFFINYYSSSRSSECSNCPWKKQLDEEGTAAASSSLGRQVGAGASRTGGGEGPWRARAALDVVTTRRQEQEAQLLPLNQPARAADAKVVSEAGLEMVSEEEDRPAPGCACGRRRR